MRAASVEHEASIFSESQSLWVVFNPADRIENDILSFSTNNPLTTTASGSQYGGTDEDDAYDEQHRRSGRFDHEDSGDDGDDELLDDPLVSLSNRINQWQLATEAAVSDNIASWDLDAELVNLLLDTSILRRVPAFYGDHCFENMSKADYVRYKRAAAMLKKSLTRKGSARPGPELVQRVLELLQWQNLIRTSGSLVNDYIINTLARTQFVSPKYGDVEFSDTATSSSLVLCGGSSWNDI